MKVSKKSDKSFSGIILSLIMYWLLESNMTRYENFTPSYLKNASSCPGKPVGSIPLSFNFSLIFYSLRRIYSSHSATL